MERKLKTSTINLSANLYIDINGLTNGLTNHDLTIRRTIFENPFFTVYLLYFHPSASKIY